MLTLNLSRNKFTENSTIGQIDIAGVHQCYTLELPQGKCIPLGTYLITLYESGRFKRQMPLLGNVPERSYIEIHWGNMPQDTEGCILVGATVGPQPDWIGNSVEAFNALFPLIEAAVADGGCEISITDPWTQALDAAAEEQAIKDSAT